MATHSSVLAWRIPGTGESGGLPSLGLHSVSDSDRRVPAVLGQESQALSCLRKGTPLASRVAQGSANSP